MTEDVHPWFLALGTGGGEGFQRHIFPRRNSIFHLGAEFSLYFFHYRCEHSPIRPTMTQHSFPAIFLAHHGPFCGKKIQHRATPDDWKAYWPARLPFGLKNFAYQCMWHKLKVRHRLEPWLHTSACPLCGARETVFRALHNCAFYERTHEFMVECCGEWRVNGKTGRWMHFPLEHTFNTTPGLVFWTARMNRLAQTHQPMATYPEARPRMGQSLTEEDYPASKLSGLGARESQGRVRRVPKDSGIKGQTAREVRKYLLEWKACVAPASPWTVRRSQDATEARPPSVPLPGVRPPRRKEKGHGEDPTGVHWPGLLRALSLRVGFPVLRRPQEGGRGVAAHGRSHSRFSTAPLSPSKLGSLPLLPKVHGVRYVQPEVHHCWHFGGLLCLCSDPISSPCMILCTFANPKRTGWGPGRQGPRAYSRIRDSALHVHMPWATRQPGLYP